VKVDKMEKIMITNQSVKFATITAYNSFKQHEADQTKVGELA
jgi:hypothetical protein